jgi:small-conductance mechanosensitive channel
MEVSVETVTGILTDILVAMALGGLGFIASIVIARMVFILGQRFMDPAMAGFLSAFTRVLVLIYTVKIIVDQVGAAGLLVVLVTAFTGAFALGSERIAGDLVAGLNLFFLRFYRVGDIVTISDYQGRISSVSLTHTSLDNDEHDRIIIPNSEIFSQIIINHSAVPSVRLRAEVPFEGEHDREEVLQQLLAAATNFEGRLAGDEHEPSVGLEALSLGEEGKIYTYAVYVYAPSDMYGEDHQLLLHVMRHLDTQVVSVPS